MRADLGADLVDRVAQLHRTLLENSSADVVERFELERHIRSELPLCDAVEVSALADLLDEQLHGLGPLDTLLADPTITEIMVNGPGPVWAERHGRIGRTAVTVDEGAIRLAVDRIIGPLGLRLDRVVPFVDARLADGSRVHVTVPPMAVDGPCITIRRFGEQVLPLSAFCGDHVGAVLAAAVHQRSNILVTGGTGAGKTSLLNTLGSGVGPGERVVTIEDTAELRLPGSHVVRLEGRPPNAEGVGEISMRTLVRNALRMRPDRIVVGEVRGGEAFEMVQALNTGHSGSLSTCHSNGPVDALDRLSAMVLMADAPLEPSLARRMVGAAFDLVVHVQRAPDGARSVTEIVRLEGDGVVPVVTGGELL